MNTLKAHIVRPAKEAGMDIGAESETPDSAGKFDFVYYQAARRGPGYFLMRLRQERVQRQAVAKTFHGQFRCSVLLPSD